MAHLVPFALAPSLGKQTNQPPKISVVSLVGKNTMTVRDRHSGQAFLIDCGAEESVFPTSATNKRQRDLSAPLVATKGTLIKTWGKHDVSLLLGKMHTFIQMSRNPFSTPTSLPPTGFPLSCPTSASSASITSKLWRPAWPAPPLF